jgi:hypothetical protein
MDIQKNTKEVKLFIGPNENANQMAYNTLKALSNTRIEVIGGAASLATYVQMPFIESHHGHRHFGQNGIEAFVHRIKSNSE